MSCSGRCACEGCPTVPWSTRAKTTMPRHPCVPPGAGGAGRHQPVRGGQEQQDPAAGGLPHAAAAGARGLRRAAVSAAAWSTSWHCCPHPAPAALADTHDARVAELAMTHCLRWLLQGGDGGAAHGAAAPGGAPCQHPGAPGSLPLRVRWWPEHSAQLALRIVVPWPPCSVFDRAARGQGRRAASARPAHPAVHPHRWWPRASPRSTSCAPRCRASRSSCKVRAAQVARLLLVLWGSAAAADAPR